MEQEPKQERIGLEVLSERLNWLLEHGEANQLRLLVMAMTEANQTDIIEFLYSDTSRLGKVADLFNLSENILFGTKYVPEEEFMRKVRDYRAGKIT